jgi:hypothetical protein
MEGRGKRRRVILVEVEVHRNIALALHLAENGEAACKD